MNGVQIMCTPVYKCKNDETVPEIGGGGGDEGEQWTE
jgi:hypothetical protein